MIRRVSVFLLALVAIVTAVNLVCQAESQSLLKPNVQDAVLNGEAKLVGRLPATQTIHFDIVLALRHQPELENFLQQVYDPTSPSYRHFVTVKEFTERFGPSQEDFDAVIAFAKASGFTVVGGSRDGFDVQLTGSVANIEKAFNVSMGEYQHPTENRTFYSPDREPTVDLSVSLQHISGLDNYSLPHPLFQHRENKVHSNATTGSCPDQSFCGSDMRAAYYESNALTGAGQNIGLLEFAGFDITDVNTYYQGADQTRTFNVTGISTDGTSINCLASQGCDDTEQTIDITQAGGMAPGVNTIYIYVGSSDTAILSGMSSGTPLPLNLSSSWSWGTNLGGDDPYFEKMAAQGQTFFQAAGDSGGYTHESPWPMNSQYTIPVGGTDLTTSGAGGPWASETVWSDGGGGWGSNVDIPSWQVAAATQCSTEGGECSTTYRDVPDVAANSNFTFYVCADQSGLTGCTKNEYGGTSFAAPMWAGYIALTNQQAAAYDDTPPGFLDPTIYPLNLGNGDIYFHDITSDANGSNGFPCVAGYNMCGGWGSPNGAGLITALAPTGPAFALSANPSSVSVTQGGQATSTITVTPEDGFSGSVTLSASGLPNGVTANFNPNPATGTSTLTFTASGTAATGTVTVTVQGVSGSLTNSTLISLTVNPLVQSFTLAASPNSLTIAKGGAGGQSTITITGVNGFNSNVTLSATGVPAGVTAVFNPNPAFPTSTLTLTAAKSAKAGTYTVTIKGVSGSLSATTTLTLTVEALGSFKLSASPSKLTVAQGSSGTSTITVEPTGGFDQAVNLTAIDVPSGVTASFSPNPTTSTSTLTLMVGDGAATGKSTITIEGTYGTITKKTKVKLTVTAP
ncbi:MAG: protease pro-enzyme activation domain-containing protein [Terriglobales bacterium]